MRDLFLVAAIGFGLLATLRYPFAGVLLWTWFTCMDPHQEVFGFAQSLQLNLIIVVVTLLAWLFSNERRAPRMDAAGVAMGLFLIWMTFNSFFAVDPGWSWPLWDRNWRIIVLGICIISLTTTKVRMHAIVWMVVISLFYYGAKGGLFTIFTGGVNRVYGPPNSMLGDNNHLAVALAMILPLANYLRMHTADRRIGLLLVVSMALTTVAIIGTYSRGGLVTLAGLAVVAWLRGRSRIIYPIAAAVIIIPAMMMMPESYNLRISTIKSAETDESFQGRVAAWNVAWDYATDHFPLGDGFSGSELPQVFNYYRPKDVTHAAHSIFFEVLGDTGFAGLAIYLVILITAFVNCSAAKRLARGQPELEWAFDLANMMQLSLFAFCLGGSALSLAYYDVFFIWVGLASALRVYVAGQVQRKARPERKVGSFVREQPGFAKRQSALPSGS